MDKALALRIRDLHVRCTVDISDSVNWVRDAESAEVSEAYLRSAKKIMGEIYGRVLEPLFREHPDIVPPGFHGEAP